MSVGPTQILIVLLLVIVIFGGKRLKNLGSDLGESLKGFKKAMKEEDKQEEITQNKSHDNIIEGEAKHKDETKS